MGLVSGERKPAKVLALRRRNATVIEQALEQHIRSRLDDRLWRQRDREIERARALIKTTARPVPVW